MKYTRLYATEDGESHFEQVEIDLSLVDYAPPAPPLELSAMNAATQFGFMQAPSGWSSDWHPSSARNFFVVLSGEWEVTASDGESRRFGAGSLLLVDDTRGRGHTSRVTSASDSVVVMVQLSN
jgi:Cupin domain